MQPPKSRVLSGARVSRFTLLMCINSLELRNRPVRQELACPPLADEEAETRGDELSCPRAHSC